MQERVLIPPTPPEDPLGSGGGGVRGDGLDAAVAHDLLGELLLGLGEAGAGPPVLGVDLGRAKGRSLGQGRKSVGRFFVLTNLPV